MKKSVEKKGIHAIIVTAIIAISCSVIASIYLKSDMIGPVGSTMIVLFIYAKFTLAMFYTQGWKVFSRKTILGMPRILFVFYIILGILLVSMYITSRQLVDQGFSDSSAKNILGLIIPASAALIGTFCMWYAGFGEWMGTGSEYDARTQFKAKGYSDELIEQKVVELKNLGII